MVVMKLSMGNTKFQSLLDAHCRNGSAIIDFEEDYTRFKSVDRLLTRYRKTGETNGGLLLNHCVILFNTFSMAAYDGFELEVRVDNYYLLGSVLVYMQRVTDESMHDLEFLKYLNKF